MTMCPNSKRACECQPQDGVMCPHGPTPDWKPWAPEIDRVMELADAYVIAASGDTASARHQYSTARSALREELERIAGVEPRMAFCPACFVEVMPERADQTLPPLPASDFTDNGDVFGHEPTPVYTANQMREYALAALAAGGGNA